jgi:hypothetical protein
MKLTTVLGSVNLNSNYYLFIPKQISFWKKFEINFIAIVVGEKIPEELIKYSSNIILWNKNLNLNTAFVAQNLRIYYSALLNLPDDELVMITDMDMLPTNDKYYKDGIDKFTHEDFIYYRNVDRNQIYMCYNAAHPKIWGKIFEIKNEKNIEDKINETYVINYKGIPGSIGWFKDQEIMYDKLIKYEHLKILNRPIKRLETWTHKNHLNNNNNNFIKNYDDAHYHRSYSNNINLILNAEKELNI